MAATKAQQSNMAMLVALLLVGGLSAFVANSPKIYSNMKKAWKASADWTAAESGNVWAIGGIGLFLIPAGMVYDALGTFGILLYGAIINTAGLALKALFLVSYPNAYLHGIFEILGIHGGCALNFGAIWTNGKAWPPKSSGLVSGVLLAIYSAGAMFMTFLWSHFFSAKAEDLTHKISDLKKADPKSPELDKMRSELGGIIQGYVWTWTIISAVAAVVVTIVLPILYNMYIAQKKAQEDARKSVTIAQQRKSILTTPPEPTWKVFTKIEAYMLMCVYLFGTAQGMAFGAAMKTVVSSYNVEGRNNSLDMAQQIGIVMLDGNFVWGVVICIGFSYASTYAALPAYVRNTFDVRQFGLVTAIGYSCMIPGNFFYTKFTAAQFDKHKDPAAEFCMGDDCNKLWCLLGPILSVIPALFCLYVSFTAERKPAPPAVVEDRKKHFKRSSIAVPEFHPHPEQDEILAEAMAADNEEEPLLATKA